MATQTLLPFTEITSSIAGALPAPVKDIAFSVDQTTADDISRKINIIFLFELEDFIYFSKPESFIIRMIKDGEEAIIRTQGNLSILFSLIENKNIDLYITAVNSVGASSETKFTLPFAKSILIKPNSSIDILLKRDIALLERTAEEIEQDKSLFVNFYRNVTFENIQLDWDDMTTNLDLSGIPPEKEKVKNSTFKSEVNINDATCLDHRFNSFSLEDDFGFNQDFYYMKLNKDGWIFQTKEEIEFIENFKDTIAVEYEKFRLLNGLSTFDNYTLKFIWQHPTKSTFSVIIYFMEGERWRL